MKKKSAPHSTLNVENDYPNSPIAISPISTPSVGPSTAMSDVEAAARAKLQSLRKDSITFCLLNALLANAPTVEGVEVVATDIIDASEQSDGLDQLAEFYKIGLLLPSMSPLLIFPILFSILCSESRWAATTSFVSSLSRPGNQVRGQRNCYRSRNCQKGSNNAKEICTSWLTSALHFHIC